jgi:hypothetical protein
LHTQAGDTWCEIHEIADERPSLTAIYQMVVWKYIYRELTQPPKKVRPGFNSVMLALILLLLASDIYLLKNLRPDYRGDRYRNAVVGLMLLFNHLAFQFRWPILTTVFLRALAWIWVVFGFVYITFLSGHLPFHNG